MKTMSSQEQFGKPKGEITEREAAKKTQWNKLLSEQKALEAVQYASREGLLQGDEDIYVALQVLVDAMERIVQAQDGAKESRDEEEFNRLQGEYDKFDEEFDAVMRWRMTELDLEMTLDR